MQAVLEGVEAHSVNHVGDKGLHQQATCLVDADAAGAHVEQGLLVKLTNSRTMGTHHIVGVNLKLGLGVHLGSGSTAQVTVALIGLDTRAIGLNQNLAGKGTDGLVIEHILEHLVAVATGCIVADKRVAIHMLLTAGDGHAQQLGLGMLAVDLDVVVIAGKTIDERDAVDEHIAALVLVNVDRRHAVGQRGALLHVIVVHR